jgi:hypothetical protein
MGFSIVKLFGQMVGKAASSNKNPVTRTMIPVMSLGRSIENRTIDKPTFIFVSSEIESSGVHKTSLRAYPFHYGRTTSMGLTQYFVKRNAVFEDKSGRVFFSVGLFIFSFFIPKIIKKIKGEA